MFTKENVTKLFKANKGRNFCISTNISVGHGINGTSFTKFYGVDNWQDGYSCSREYKHNNSKIIKFDNDFLTLENDVDDEHYNSGKFIVNIPYENINSITFIVESKRFGNTL